MGRREFLRGQSTLSLSSYHIHPLVEARSSPRRKRSKELYWPRWSCHVELETKYIFSRRSRSIICDAPDIARLTILAHLEKKMRVKGIFIFFFYILAAESRDVLHALEKRLLCARPGIRRAMWSVDDHQLRGTECFHRYY